MHPLASVKARPGQSNAYRQVMMGLLDRAGNLRGRREVRDAVLALSEDNPLTSAIRVVSAHFVVDRADDETLAQLLEHLTDEQPPHVATVLCQYVRDQCRERQLDLPVAAETCDSDSCIWVG